MEIARRICIIQAQKEIQSVLEDSVTVVEKIHGQYRRLSPFLDEEIWRVKFRTRDYVPFIQNYKPPAFLQKSSRLMFLLMREVHERKRSGVEETIAQFCMRGRQTR